MLDVVEEGLLLAAEESRVAGEALGYVAQVAHLLAEGFYVAGEVGVGLEAALDLREFAAAFAEGAVYVGGVGEASGGEAPVAAVGGVTGPAVVGAAASGSAEGASSPGLLAALLALALLTLPLALLAFAGLLALTLLTLALLALTLLTLPLLTLALLAFTTLLTLTLLISLLLAARLLAHGLFQLLPELFEAGQGLLGALFAFGVLAGLGHLAGLI